MTRSRASPGRAASAIIADACHAPGATYKGRNAGTLARHFLFLVPSRQASDHLRRRHGGDRRCRTWRRICAASAITASTATIARREASGAHAYDMAELGYNYRLPDVQCALGLAQLKRLDGWVAARQKIAALYDDALAGLAEVVPLKTHADRTNAHHLYVVRLMRRHGPRHASSPRLRARRHRRQCPLCAGLSAFLLSPSWATSRACARWRKPASRRSSPCPCSRR